MRDRLEQLRQKGFVDLDKWEWGAGMTTSAKDQQEQLLAVLHNDPQPTWLE